MNSRLYSIIGADKREYGPVSIVEIQEWILQGRISRRAKILVEGSKTWVTIASLPEFSDSLAAQARYFSLHRPSVPSSCSSTDLAPFAARASSLDLASCFDRSWSLLIENAFLLAGSSALILLIELGLLFIPFVGLAISALLGLVFWAGLALMLLRLIRGESCVVVDAFSGFRQNFPQLLFTSFILCILCFVGLLSCLLPGFYLFLAWFPFTPLLLLDKGLGPWTALETSRLLFTSSFWPFLSLFLMCFAVLVGGFFVLGFGFLLALPLASGALVYAYEDIFSSPF